MPIMILTHKAKYFIRSNCLRRKPRCTQDHHGSIILRVHLIVNVHMGRILALEYYSAFPNFKTRKFSLKLLWNLLTGYVTFPVVLL